MKQYILQCTLFLNLLILFSCNFISAQDLTTLNPGYYRIVGGAFQLFAIDTPLNDYERKIPDSSIVKILDNSGEEKYLVEYHGIKGLLSYYAFITKSRNFNNFPSEIETDSTLYYELDKDIRKKREEMDPKVQSKNAEKILEKLEIARGEFVDKRDGNTYAWVQIGKQIWMAENLRYDAGSVCWDYSQLINGSEYLEKYGRLYPYLTALLKCPSGWHLPSNEEWIQLEMYLGIPEGYVNMVKYRGIVQGHWLKSNKGWQSDGNGNNFTGFSAIPAGCTISDKYTRESYAYFWTSTSFELDDVKGIIRILSPYEKGIGVDFAPLTHGYSVRCIKDKPF